MTIGTYQTARPLRHGPQRLVISALLVAAAAFGCGAPDNPTDDAGQPQSVPDKPSKPSRWRCSTSPETSSSPRA